MPSFNLIDEPWIPCCPRPGGPMQELSLREVLNQAGQIAEITDQSPLVTLALHRLLLAILHRNFGPQRRSDWERLWNGSSFSSLTLEEYFARWYDRFDLFDETRPFYQNGDLSFENLGPISKLAHELSSGNNATLFDHTTDDAGYAVTPAQAARLLIAFQAFAVGGLVSYEKGRLEDKSANAAPLAKGAVALIRGQNLFCTLLLNLHRYSMADGDPFPMESNDAPAWEREENTRAIDRRPVGYLDLLTWQSRRIQLLPSVDLAGQVLVRNVVIMKGFQFPDGYWRYGKETMLAFRKAAKAKETEDPWPVIGFQPDRVLWRDSLALFQSIAEEQARPMTLDWLNEVTEAGAFDRKAILPLDYYGLSTDKAKVLFWRHERLRLPLAYLDDHDLYAALEQGLALAEAVAAALDKGIWSLAKVALVPQSDRPEARQPRTDVIRPLVQRLAPGQLYWSKLEVPFRHFLIDLADDRSGDGLDEIVEYGRRALPAWADELRRVASLAFSEATAGLDLSGRTLKALAVGENRFRRELFTALHDTLIQNEEETREPANRA